MKRQVVNINENVYEKLQEYCNVHNFKINGFVETLINKGIKTMTADIARQQTQEFWKEKEADLDVDRTYLASILKSIDDCSKAGNRHLDCHDISPEKQKSIEICLKNRGFKVSVIEDDWNKKNIKMMIDW